MKRISSLPHCSQKGIKNDYKESIRIENPNCLRREAYQQTRIREAKQMARDRLRRRSEGRDK